MHIGDTQRRLRNVTDRMVDSEKRMLTVRR